jgi:heme/copper-type cytochrome/quinol oxidase subunit 3
MAVTEAPYETPILDPPPRQPARPRVLLIGTAFAAAASVMVFAGLMGAYLGERAAAINTGSAWIPDDVHLPLAPGTIGLATFVLSGITMWWAVDAVGRNDRAGAYLALALTIMFGLCVINASSFLYGQSGLAVATKPGLLIFTITGLHLVMVVGALVYAAVMTFRTLGGEYQGHRDREGLVAAALYWYTTIAVYAVIWYAIYVTK